MKLSSILMMLILLTSCISKDKVNESVIQEYWKLDASTNRTDRKFSLLYFRGNHAMIRGYEQIDADFTVYNGVLNLKFHRPFETTPEGHVKIEIISLNHNHLVIVLNEDTLSYNRKLEINTIKPISFNLANSGLQDLEMEIKDNLQCKCRNMDDSMIDTIKIVDIPKWKWLVLRDISQSMKLKSYKNYNTTPVACGGEFSCIIETDKGTYQYFGIGSHTNSNELQFLTESIWQIGCSTIYGGTKEKGQLRLHKKLVDLYPALKKETRVLQFVPPIK